MLDDFLVKIIAIGIFFFLFLAGGMAISIFIQIFLGSDSEDKKENDATK